MSIKITLNRLLAFPISLLFILSAAGVKAESRLIPGFLFVESAYLQQQANSANTADAYITVTNLHPDDPLVLLNVSSENIEAATFNNADNPELNQIVIQPGERKADIHMVLSGVDLADSPGDALEFSLLIRRGLEAMEPVDAIINDEGQQGAFFGGIKNREAGIPNEDEYVVIVDVRN